MDQQVRMFLLKDLYSNIIKIPSFQILLLKSFLNSVLAMMSVDILLNKIFYGSTGENIYIERITLKCDQNTLITNTTP